MSLMDLLMRTKIFEMAYNRQKILDDCHNLTKQILLHLVKLKCFYNKEDSRGHIRSIDGWLYDIQDMTLDGKKRLKPKDYFKALFLEPIDSGEDLENRFKRLIKQGYKASHTPDFETLYLEAKTAFQSISNDIANNNFTTIEDYFNFKES